MTSCDIITNTSDGIRFFNFNSTDGLKLIAKESENAARAICYTPDGSVLGISDGERISIRNGDDNIEFASIDHTNVSKLVISPDAKYICTFEPFRKTPEYPEGRPNLHVFEVASGKVIDCRVHTLEGTWRPQWSLDSKLCVRVWQGEIQFYVNNNLGEKPAKRLTLKGMRHCSLSKSVRNRNIAVYTPGEKSAPATVYIYAWRNGDCVAVANKSFFRADTVSFHWSDIGTSLLVLASTKVRFYHFHYLHRNEHGGHEVSFGLLLCCGMFVCGTKYF
ncbi:unnamed protein product [Hydatigera taeniaeformis]|uniref:Eukaryotic translation initiation factor 2A n=1 Tax=Hydatigena taeniaeformis TaxID=6205 RepID=A0A0R3WVL7_HYDTA|nr:unnamed protein product [Hydatigera taeniaeformis]